MCGGARHRLRSEFWRLTSQTATQQSHTLPTLRPDRGGRSSYRRYHRVASQGNLVARDRPLSHSGAVGVALFVTVLWSSSWILIRWGLDGEGLEPITFAALRYGLAAVVVTGWMLRRRRAAASLARVTRSTVIRVLLLGVAMYALTQGAQFVAIDNQPAATSSLVLSMTPLLVAGLAVVSLGEVPASRQVGGAFLVVAGAWLYFSGELGATMIGMIAAVVGLLANVGAALLGRHVNRGGEMSPIAVTALSMSVGALVLVAVGLISEGIPAVSLKAWLIISWLAVVNTALAFTLWNLSLKRLSAVESAGINNTMMIQIAVLAWVFLDEPLGAPEFIGIALVSVGIFFTQSAPHRRLTTASGA